MEMDHGSLDMLINLKFHLEREISLYNDSCKIINESSLSLNNKSDLLELYEKNIYLYGKPYIEMQIKLLDNVNINLYNLCQHNWTEDTIEDAFRERNICYCSKCFVRQK